MAYDIATGRLTISFHTLTTRWRSEVQKIDSLISQTDSANVLSALIGAGVRRTVTDYTAPISLAISCIGGATMAERTAASCVTDASRSPFTGSDI